MKLLKGNMAEEEKAPLLVEADDDEEDHVKYRGPSPRQKVKSLYQSAKVLGRHSPYTGLEDEIVNISASSSMHNFNLAEEDCVVSIFVVAFDTKAGNVIEWCMPEDADLEGVEFKAIASGSHTLDKDFVYFRKGAQYGLACFENMPVESEIERGARMKSVGILATSYTLLYRHMQFLETQVRHQLLCRDEAECNGTAEIYGRHQLETPGRYSHLMAFYEDKKGTLPFGGALPVSGSSHSISNLSSPGSEILPELKITHPAGCFSQFIKFFGVQIFVLWKYTLLQKRILFFSPPPIGVVCYRVYCACCLGNHNIENRLTDRHITPHFYVNVADIETLETEMAYVACTTEKIFEMKTQLYDIYVDNQNVTAHVPAMQELLKVSDADRDKYQKLNNERTQNLFADQYGVEEPLDEEEIFTSFFTEQNNRLFQTLLDISMSQDRQLTSEHMKSMGLDPVGDRAFLMELVEIYGIDVMLMVDNPCCPR